MFCCDLGTERDWTGRPSKRTDFLKTPALEMNDLGRILPMCKQIWAFNDMLV